MEKGEVGYHQGYEELEGSLPKKRWVANHQRPTTEPKVVEEYLGRYTCLPAMLASRQVCRIGISHKRLSYDAQGGNVRITYNNYRKQEAGKPAPKAYKDMPPLLAMHQILQHLLPAYFQRSRHYGLHAAPTYGRLKGVLPKAVRRNGATVRTIVQLLKALLKEEPYRCGACQGEAFTVTPLLPDEAFIERHLGLPQGWRAPPKMPRRAPTAACFA
jgi:hypothetical protein